MNIPSSSATSSQLLASRSVSPPFAREEPGTTAEPRSLFDAAPREASRDTGSAIATGQSGGVAGRLEDLYRGARRRPQMASGLVAAVALAAGTLLWSAYGRGLLAVGSGYAVERLFGSGLKRRASRLLSRARRHR